MPDKNLPAFPRARSTELVTETIGSEIVVYDGATKDAHHLAPLAAAVFTAADGHTSTADIAAIASKQLGEDFVVADVEQALAELEVRNLIIVSGDGVSRREVLRRGALVGGAALAAPLVTSLATPDYGHASSLSSLSYVVAVFKVGTTYYRAKRANDGTVTWSWTDATPGTNCSFTPSGTRSNNPSWANLVTFSETPGSGGTTNITITWPRVVPGTSTSIALYDVRIKCANDCHVALSSSSQTCSSGSSCSRTYVGCP